MSADCHLTSHWRVPGALDEVALILRRPRDLARWWSEVHLEVQVENEGDIDQVAHDRAMAMGETGLRRRAAT